LLFVGGVALVLAGEEGKEEEEEDGTHVFEMFEGFDVGRNGIPAKV
jgi:hypothetical protein